MVTKQTYKLVLYISGQTPVSVRAVANMRRLISDLESTKVFELEVVDINEKPEQAEENKILATPMAIKHLPEPVRRLVGDLSNRDQVLAGLDLFPLE